MRMKKIALIIMVLGLSFSFSGTAEAQKRRTLEARTNRMVNAVQPDEEGRITKEQFLNRPRTTHDVQRERRRNNQEGRNMTQEDWFYELNDRRKERERLEREKAAEERKAAIERGELQEEDIVEEEVLPEGDYITREELMEYLRGFRR